MEACFPNRISVLDRKITLANNDSYFGLISSFTDSLKKDPALFIFLPALPLSLREEIRMLEAGYINVVLLLVPYLKYTTEDITALYI